MLEEAVLLPAATQVCTKIQGLTSPIFSIKMFLCDNIQYNFSQLRECYHIPNKFIFLPRNFSKLRGKYLGLVIPSQTLFIPHTIPLTNYLLLFHRPSRTAPCSYISYVPLCCQLPPPPHHSCQFLLSALNFHQSNLYISGWADSPQILCGEIPAD